MAEDENMSTFPAAVVKIIDDFTLVINRGSEHGVSKGNHFLVYYVDSDEIIDPETGESLGALEIVRGTGTATHVQPKLTTIKSNRVVSKGRVIRRQAGIFASLSGEIVEEPEKEAVPFEDPNIGDKVKPV
ncbi:hypothetical protein SAMN05216369_2505 [Marinobacter antarcticus]|uniref:Uncharacterized protein n=1 Tax=Marinobacter antarcticus TaxID=564117 RepID=A0A1M6TZM0_9GAMM|nr:hypothetical protein [Marinobacter antarcticus]SHK62340.1 hypothetical protein SAMN05216369_2505 [Marinobacter antarcticus]